MSRIPDEIADTMQTNGVELDDIVHKKCVLRIREIGGAFVEVRARSTRLHAFSDYHCPQRLRWSLPDTDRTIFL